MKLPQTVRLKYTTRKFNNKYKYKAVLKYKFAEWFKHNDLSKAAFKLKHTNSKEADLGRKILAALETLEDYQLRIERPWICFYTDKSEDLTSIVNVLENCVEYVQIPKPGTKELLDQGLILTKTITQKYRVSIGRTTKCNKDFVNWAEKHGQKLPATAKKELSKESGCYGGFYLYLKDDKSLTIARLMLGDAIAKIEEVVKH